MKTLMIIFGLFFGVSAFSQTFLTINHPSFASNLLTRFLNTYYNITNRQDYTISNISNVLSEVSDNETTQIYFRPHEDFRYNLSSTVQNYLGSKVEIVYKNDLGVRESVEGLFAEINIAVTERIATNKIGIQYYITAQKSGHYLSLSVNGKEFRIALEDLLEIHLIDRRETRLPNIGFAPFSVVNRALITNYQVFAKQITRESLFKDFNTTNLYPDELNKILQYSKNIGRNVMVFLNPQHLEELPKIVVGQIIGVGITTTRKRGNIKDLYSTGFEISKAKILANQNYLLLKVNDKDVRIFLHNITSTYEFEGNGCAPKMINFKHTP